MQMDESNIQLSIHGQRLDPNLCSSNKQANIAPIRLLLQTIVPVNITVYELRPTIEQH